ncbi:unnamed protein product [Rotaria sordida]|uniref:Methyltransferase domain-containing protein n=1 Tax=Rotaria sordida TaxID=392033 RepID=A0A815SQT7_9BILA|nr:unnamed protein product [Rotaria sordida]CAF4152505.1 unnamed protein product [Rotaria sordida]
MNLPKFINEEQLKDAFHGITQNGAKEVYIASDIAGLSIGYANVSFNAIEDRNNQLESLEEQWNKHAEDWNEWIGDDGDSNRKESSDIYLWKYIGNVDNKVILDAGCGNGYLTIKFVLETRIKRIIGVDLSSALIKIAKEDIDRRIKRDEDHKKIELYHDSVTELKSIENNSIDLIIANYVLMDTPDLDSVIKAFERVLKSSGRVIIVILHPCFDIVPEKDGSKRIYTWTKSYFDETPERQKWETFLLDHYHRPLSVYFQVFHKYGFTLMDFDEPKFFSPKNQYDCTCAVLFHLKKN